MSDELPLELLHTALEYNPATGEFVWRHNGRTAGCKRTDGRGWQICFRQQLYLAHRLAWFWMNGTWPLEVDHRDRDPLNNRWDNLREATRSQNNGNTAKNCRNKTGFKGVHKHSETGRYVAQIKLDRKRRSLGTFATPEEAHAAYCKAALVAFGPFARF